MNGLETDGVQWDDIIYFNLFYQFTCDSHVEHACPISVNTCVTFK